MDFNNSPDFGDLPVPDTSSQTTPDFPPPPDFDVPAAGAPTAEGGVPNADLVQGATAPVDKKQFIYTLLIALFITLVVGAIILFGITTYMKANEPAPTTSKYQFGNGTAVSPTKPAPTRTVAPASVASPSATLTPEAAASDWRIRMKQQNLKLSTLASIKIGTVSATLFGPEPKDTYICTSAATNDIQYFTYKKSDKVFERLCDSTLERQAQKLTCSKYDTDLGIPISQTIYPMKDCRGGAIEPGTYVLYSKVYFDCDLAGKPLSDITSDACKQSKEVYSDEMTVEE